jgi:hypothetical protein
VAPLAALATALPVAKLAGQSPVIRTESSQTSFFTPSHLAEASAGSGLERYLRVLQVAGLAPVRAWSIRGFSLHELEDLQPATWDPWNLSLSAASGRSPARAYLIRPELRGIFNSSYPFGFNDGPIWAGKGLTVAVHGGVAARMGPLSLALDPVYFSARNAGFPLLENGLSGPMRFADGQLPTAIDLPQRFGDSPYQRLDAGNSYVRLDFLRLAAGVSTASQWWGPAIDSPLILGNNAGGFPHAFVGTASPVNVGIGRLHARVEVGRLDQSEYSSIPADSGHRLMAAAIIVFSPRGVSGLELGTARFFHRRWRGGISLSDFGIPLQGFTSGTIDYSEKYDPTNPAYEPENQLVSAFARWVFPQNGFEFYGEYMRNDRNFDLRDALLEPDHDAAFTLGFQRVWTDSIRGRLLALHGEVANAQFSHLENVRAQSWPYSHSPIAQGHTERGQSLGSYFVERGGGGAVVGVDVYHPKGRVGLELMRIVRGLPQTAGLPIGTRDVMYAGTAEAVYVRNKLELFGGVSLMNEMNRNLAGDRINVGLTTGVRAQP